MPVPEKSFTRKAVESLALKLIIFIAGLAGAAVLGWLAVNSAWLHGVPGYKVALIVAVLFALCGIGLYFVILAIARIPLRNAPAGSLLEPEDNWLLAVAKEQRCDISRFVRVERQITGNAGLFLEPPDEAYLNFGVSIFNGSVYDISIERKIEGYISFGRQRLGGRIEAPVSPYKVPENLKPGWTDHVSIRQWLSKEEAAIIRANDAGQFYFDNLIVIIKGGDDYPQVAPKPLSFATLQT